MKKKMNSTRKANNNHINPVLYKLFLRLKSTLGAEIVHRRSRKSATSIEIVFHSPLVKYLHGRLNTLKEAEKSGFWVILRLQSKRNHESWRGLTVYQLFLTPVHPKKRNEARYLATPTSEEVTVKPIVKTTRPKAKVYTVNPLPLLHARKNQPVSPQSDVILPIIQVPRLLSHDRCEFAPKDRS